MSNSTNSKKVLAMLALAGGIATVSFAQTTFFNNGALVYIAPLGIMHVNGGFQNDGAAGTTPIFQNDGTLTVANSGTPGTVFLTNGSTFQGNGTDSVAQDWVNDATFTANNSTVILNGNVQEFITSTIGTSTTFHNLMLTGTGAGVTNRKKTLQLVNASINATGTLTINDRELETLTNIMFVLNPSTACVTNNTTPGTEGFVSSSVGGTLSRVTNSASAYLFPTGSSVGTTRYRPAKLTPAAASADTYTGRLGNNNATVDGFNTASLDTNMCIVNPLYYHQIARTAGTDNAGIDIFYDQAADGGWDGLAQWNTPTAALWNSMGTVTATASVPLNDVLKINWADFSNTPYILSHQKPAMPVLACVPVCANTPGNFSATGTGSTFTWTSPAGTTIVSGQGTDAVVIDWNSVTGPVTVTTTSPLGCASSAASCAVTVSVPPVAAFDTTSTGFTYNFSDMSTGGATSWAWSFGDGSSSNSQNPSHTYTGDGVETVCLIASNANSCADTTCRSLDVSVFEYINIPNVFTPDGDGTNDYFTIKNSGLKEFSIEIYNRWGIKVFESTNPSVDWDGRSTAGVVMSDGTYYYILHAVSVTSKDYSQNGFISLLRK